MTAMSAHFVTAGGGGFSMSANGAPTALDRYLLDLSGKASPLVCFIPTASADDPTYINRFLVAYGTLGVRPMVCTLWQSARTSVERLAEADVVIVGGGSTVNLVALWKAHKVDVAMAGLAARDDVVLAGLSAGASCWYGGCITDSFGGTDPWVGGLELLPGSFCPHFDGEAERAPRYVQAITYGDLPAGYGADDGAAVHWKDGVVVDHLAESVKPKVYRVEPSDQPGTSGVVVEPQAMTVL